MHMYASNYLLSVNVHNLRFIYFFCLQQANCKIQTLSGLTKVLKHTHGFVLPLMRRSDSIPKE